MLPYHPISSHTNRPSILHGRFILKCVLTSIISLLQRAKKFIQNKQTDKKRMKENKQDKIFFFIMSSISHYLTNFPFTMISPRRNSARSFIRMQVGECWWKLVFLLSLSLCVYGFGIFLFSSFATNEQSLPLPLPNVVCGGWLVAGWLTDSLAGWLVGIHSIHSLSVSRDEMLVMFFHSNAVFHNKNKKVENKIWVCRESVIDGTSGDNIGLAKWENEGGGVVGR